MIGKKEKGKLKIVLVACLAIGILFTRFEVQAAADITPNAKSSILIELSTGRILSEKRSNERRAPASMTKIMTMKLIFDALSDGVLTLEQEIQTSATAASQGGSQIFLSVGETMKVDDLIKAVTIASANDAAVSLAEAICGSVDAFVEKMNTEAENLGLQNSNFMNVTGLPADEHYSSSYDMAMISRALLLKHEKEVLRYTSIYEDYLRVGTPKQFWLVNTNRLVKHIEGMDGLKTGWTAEAGYCLTSTKKVDGMRLVTVVMGCASPDVRTEDTLALLNYGFANYKKVVLKSKDEILATSSDLRLEPLDIKITLKEDLTVIIAKSEKLPKYTYVVNVDKTKLKEGQYYDVGSLEIYDGVNLVRTEPIVVSTTVSKTNFFQIILRVINMMFG